VHWPLAAGRLDRRTSWASGGVVSCTVVDTGATDRELAAIVDFLANILRLPLTVHEASWMPDGHEDGGEDHHTSLEDHEGNLLVGELTVEAVGELSNTEA
jgi:hypothetical protein